MCCAPYTPYHALADFCVAELLAQTTGTASTITQPIAEDEDAEDSNGDEFDRINEPFRTGLVIEKPSTKYTGPGSADYFLNHLKRYFPDVQPDEPPIEVTANFYASDALPSRRSLVLTQVRLPPLDVARRWFAAQYTYIGTIFAFTDPASFEHDLLAAYQGQPDLLDKDSCLTYAKVLIILAFGKLYSVNKWIDYQGPPGFEYFSQALELLPDAHEEGSILCVETLTLVGYFLQNMNRHDAAFLYIGMALRMAISLGLHQEVSTSGHGPVLDEAAREHRRRVWWSVYSMDRILSVKSGNPITIDDADIGVELPSRLPGETEYCPAVVLRHYTQLSRILGDVSKAVYRKSTATKSSRRPTESVHSIMEALSTWERELPDELRFDAAKLSTTRESVSTFSHYYQCINMTARPLLFHVVRDRLRAIRADPAAKETDWRGGLSSTAIHVIERAIYAAQHTIEMMSKARERDLVATYGYMDGEHVFSATIVLVLVCGAFPANDASADAMKVGMDLLRGMAERGGSNHMASRYCLLDRMRSAFLPGHPALPAPQLPELLPAPAPLHPGLTSPLANPAASPWPGVQSPMTENLMAAQAAMGIRSPYLASPSLMFASPSPGGRTSVGTAATADIGGDLGHHNLGPTDLFSGIDPAALARGVTMGEQSMGGVDLTLLEEVFATSTANANYDFSQWQWAQGGTQGGNLDGNPGAE